MATKKQKRETALAKREAFLTEERAAGLEAQKKDREVRAAKEKRIQTAAAEINAKHRAVLEASGII